MVYFYVVYRPRSGGPDGRHRDQEDMLATKPTTTDAEPQTSTLSRPDCARLFKVLGRMSYGDGLRPTTPWDQLTVDELVATLEALAVRLRDHAAECQKRDDELQRHRSLIRGGRQLLAEMLPPEVLRSMTD